MSTDPFSDPDPESAPAAPVDSFEAAKAPVAASWGALLPYTRPRYLAAQSMGLLYPYVGDAGLAQHQATGMYPGMVKDVLIICWICSAPHAAELTEKQRAARVMTVETALLKPLVALEIAMAWGEKQGLLDPFDPRFKEAHAAFDRIVAPVEAAKFEVTQAGAAGGKGGADPNASAPPAGPNT